MNLIIKILAMMITVIEITVIIISVVGGLLYAVLYAFLWLVGALSVLTVSMYQWWVKLLTGAKEVGRADYD